MEPPPPPSLDDLSDDLQSISFNSTTTDINRSTSSDSDTNWTVSKHISFNTTTTTTTDINASNIEGDNGGTSGGGGGDIGSRSGFGSLLSL
ncbi:hypothetical protein QVD17_32013 [Tagetes erecta]|uniref:Uncharacterized protein n=1 Tax=Tagetes erecta TaxID=13708 RepID=A0AAD8NP28_TARER|nr:hypothetical protein QVD17_32013 [Tagetes erecta]